MDRSLELQNKQSMRKTILMQEDMFKQQVQELHRLYNLQTKLMHELEKGITRQKDPRPARETGHSFQACSDRNDPKELSSSCSAETSTVPIKFDLERPSESIPLSILLCEDQRNSRSVDEESDVEVELTLGIGHCTRKQKSKQGSSNADRSNQVRELGSSSTRLSKRQEHGDASSNISSSRVCQDNAQPHWILQDLSLNRI